MMMILLNQQQRRINVASLDPLQSVLFHHLSRIVLRLQRQPFDIKLPQTIYQKYISQNPRSPLCHIIISSNPIDNLSLPPPHQS